MTDADEIMNPQQFGSDLTELELGFRLAKLKVTHCSQN